MGGFLAQREHPVVRVTPQIGKNRLVIEISGRPSQAELEPLEQDLKAAVSRLRVPFDVLSDVHDLESLDGVKLDGVVALGHLLKSTGVRRVVRVVGKSSSGAVHMERLARLIRHSAHLAFTREEAEAMLDRA